MPLSEHEQKMLDAMERALYAEDPTFATSMKGRGAGPNKGRVVAGLLVALLGLGLVVLGVWSQLVLVGGLGFAVMVAGAVWALTPSTPAQAGARRAAPAAARRQGRAPKQSGTFMQRMEERWDKRRREGL